MVNSMVKGNSYHVEERVMKVSGKTGNTMDMVYTFLVRGIGKETSMKVNLKMVRKMGTAYIFKLMGANMLADSRMD